MHEGNIANKLTKLRSARQLKQEDVASALSVSAKTVSKWENGTTSPDLDMLIALSEFYDVSTDTLLGLKNEDKSTGQIIAEEFKGLSKQETALKIFEIILAVFPASYDAACFDELCDDTDIFPPNNGQFDCCRIEAPELFSYAVTSDDVNISVTQLRNKSNFSWLYDEVKCDQIIKLFGFLANPDALKIFAFIHTTTCSDNFTVDYISKNTDVPLENAVKILDTLCKLYVCYKETAHLGTGDMTVYESSCDGLTLAIISLAYEKMYGKNSYSYDYNGKCKMIKGDKK